MLNMDNTARYVENMRKGKLAIFQAWRLEWVGKVFPTLIARAKWQKIHPNVKPDTVGLVQYESKFSDDTWKLARVVNTFPDRSGQVRTIEVQLGVKPGQLGGPAHLLTIPVQRFCPMFTPEE